MYLCLMSQSLLPPSPFPPLPPSLFYSSFSLSSPSPGYERRHIAQERGSLSYLTFIFYTYTQDAAGCIQNRLQREGEIGRKGKREGGGERRMYIYRRIDQ